MDRASARVLCITMCSNLTSVGVLLSARHNAGPDMTLPCRRSGANLSVKVLDFVQFRGLFERSGVEFEPVGEATDNAISEDFNGRSRRERPN